MSVLEMRLLHRPLFFFLLFLPTLCFGFKINRLNGGVSATYVDFSIAGKVAPLEIKRSYNSITASNNRSAWDGVFGWGWTTEFETTLTVTPQQNVLLRDGGSGNTILFEPKNSDPRLQAKFYAEFKKKYFERQQGRAVTDVQLRSLKLPDNITTKLRNDPKFRLEMSVKYGIEGKIPQGRLLISTKYGYQTLEFKNGKWIRERNGIAQYFDEMGRLVRQIDANGFYFDYKYDATNRRQLREIVSRDRTASVKFAWANNRIASITGNKGEVATYTYDSRGNLIKSVDSLKGSYGYRYDNAKFPYLLTRIDYLDESSSTKRVSRYLTYDSQGMVTMHKHKNGLEESIAYGKKLSNPKENFWTTVSYSNRPNTDMPSQIREEYFIKSKVDGSKYLYKQITENIHKFGTKKKVDKLTVLYSACCGKPLQVIDNGVVTKFKYYENGLLKQKQNPQEDLLFEYDPSTNLITKLTRNGFQTTYNYDQFRNLILVANAKVRLALKHDRNGHIVEMNTGRKGTMLTFNYNDLGRPTTINKRGVGQVALFYGPFGEVKKTESLFPGGKKDRRPTASQSDRIMTDVMGSFNEFLNLIRPATETNYEGIRAWTVEY